MTEHRSEVSVQQEEVVPTRWPAERSDGPRPVWTIRGLPSLPGMILLWFSPGRVGANLAASGWRGAIGAHVLGVLLGLGLILFANLLQFDPFAGLNTQFMSFHFVPPGHDLTLSETMRGPFLAIVCTMHEKVPPGTIPRWVWVYGAIAGGVLLLTMLLMPFAAAGESARRLSGRCLRLSLWSTTLLIPLGVGWYLAPRWRKWLDLPDEWHPVDWILLLMFACWWVVVLLRSGRRYAGPAEGPAWRTRRPRCEGCGYEIVGLPVSTNCPECSRPVAESLPRRRTAPAFANSERPRRAVRAFLSALKRVVTDKTFFDTLAIHRGYGGARSFYLWLCVANVPLMFGVALCLHRIYAAQPLLGHALIDALTLSVALLVGQLLLPGLATGMLAVLGRRPFRPLATGMFYAFSPLLPLSAAFAVLGAALPFTAAWVDDGHEFGAMYLLLGTALAAGLVGLGWGVVLTVVNLGRVYRRTRFANA